MPAYLGPPPGPWIPRPESAFRPIRAWLPYDHGARFREILRGDHAPIAGTAAWSAGPYGRCFQGDGSSYGVSGSFASMDVLSVTVAHISGAASFRGLVGWGANFQGILYSGSRIALIDSGTAERFNANLSTPTAAWRVITLTLAGHAPGAAAEFWADGARISSGTISSSAGTISPATQITIGAVRGGTNPWQAGIGPVYLHDRVLSAREIAALHADPWRVLRDFRDDTPRKFYSIPVPFNFSASGTSEAPSGAGALGFGWGASIAATSAPPAGAASFGLGWSVAIAGASAAPAGAAAIGSSWGLAAAGASGDPGGSTELDWPAAIAGAGASAAPAGAIAFDWTPPPPPILTLEAIRAACEASPELAAACPELWLDRADELAEPPYAVLTHLWARTEVTTGGAVEVDEERIQIGWVGAGALAARDLGELGRKVLHFAPLDGGTWPILHCLHEQSIGPIRDPDRAPGQSHCWVLTQEYSILRNRRGDS